jgi:hypothetical protein
VVAKVPIAAIQSDEAIDCNGSKADDQFELKISTRFERGEGLANRFFLPKKHASPVPDKTAKHKNCHESSLALTG